MILSTIFIKLLNINNLISNKYVLYILLSLAVISFYSILGMFLVYMERKVCAFMQIRKGPNVVGIYGILQTLADTIKLVFKENFTPKYVDKLLYYSAPIISILIPFILILPIPFNSKLQFWDIDIGVLFIISFSSLSVLAILIAGWSSHNKFSIIGAMRSGAQIISYELSGGIAILTVIIFCQDLQISKIIESQSNGWWIIKGHLPIFVAFIIYLIALTAECNRAPFDLTEAESELTAGFHTEYSGMKFALFFLSEYLNIFILCSLGTILFLGGWLPFYLPNCPLFNLIMGFFPPILWFFLKVFTLIFIVMWFRWTFPRLRVDQLLKLEWKYLLPISLVNLLIGSLVLIFNYYIK